MKDLLMEILFLAAITILVLAVYASYWGQKDYKIIKTYGKHKNRRHNS